MAWRGDADGGGSQDRCDSACDAGRAGRAGVDAERAGVQGADEVEGLGRGESGVGDERGGMRAGEERAIGGVGAVGEGFFDDGESE